MICVLVLLTLFTCREELDGVTTVEFITAKQSLKEGDSLSVYLSIKGNGVQDDTVIISIEQPLVSIAADPPIENDRVKVPVHAGQSLVALKIFAIDNGRLEGDRSVKLSLSNLGPRLRAGAVANLALLVRDDEVLSTAEFALTEASYHEGESEGFIVQIPLSMQLEGEGTGELRISITSINAFYGVHYTTLPEAINGIITLPVGKGAAATSFEVLVIDNDRLDGQVSVTFRIEGGFGSIGKGKNINFVLTLIDDEHPSYINFQSNTLVVDEDNLEGLTVDIFLDKPASGEGTFSIGFLKSVDGFDETNAYGEDLTTDPPAGSDKTIPFSVKKGDDHFSFKIFPINDSECGTRSFSIYTSSASGVLRSGPAPTVFIRDDESPKADLLVTSGSVLENSSTGISIQITLSKPTPVLDNVAVFVDAGYGTRFLTYPPMNLDLNEFNNYLVITFPPGSTSAEFKVFPINNFLKADDYEAEFKLAEQVWGCITVPMSKIFKLYILNDD